MGIPFSAERRYEEARPAAFAAGPSGWLKRLNDREKSAASPANGMTSPRQLHVKSFGCQMNVYDSFRMADTLAPEGFAETERPEDADLVILNTCHIREKATDKVYSELGYLRLLKEQAAAEGRRFTIAALRGKPTENRPAA